MNNKSPKVNVFGYFGGKMPQKMGFAINDGSPTSSFMKCKTCANL